MTMTYTGDRTDVPPRAGGPATRRMDAALDELHGSGRHTACETAPDVFFSTVRAERRVALELCAACPVIAACRAYAAEAFAGLAAAGVTGVWGGVDYTNPRSRRAA
jgi:hypothetical protein